MVWINIWQVVLKCQLSVAPTTILYCQEVMLWSVNDCKHNRGGAIGHTIQRRPANPLLQLHHITIRFVSVEHTSTIMSMRIDHTRSMAVVFAILYVGLKIIIVSTSKVKHSETSNAGLVTVRFNIGYRKLVNNPYLYSLLHNNAIVIIKINQANQSTHPLI